MDETFDTVEVTFNEETGIGHLTLNRPDALNALSGQLQEDIVEGLRVLEAENENGRNRASSGRHRRSGWQLLCRRGHQRIQRIQPR